MQKKNLSLIRGHRPTQGTPAPLAANPTLATTGLRTAVPREIIVEGGGKGRGDQGGGDRSVPRTVCANARTERHTHAAAGSKIGVRLRLPQIARLALRVTIPLKLSQARGALSHGGDTLQILSLE